MVMVYLFGYSFAFEVWFGLVNMFISLVYSEKIIMIKSQLKNNTLSNFKKGNEE